MVLWIINTRITQKLTHFFSTISRTFRVILRLHISNVIQCDNNATQRTGNTHILMCRIRNAHVPRLLGNFTVILVFSFIFYSKYIINKIFGFQYQHHYRRCQLPIAEWHGRFGHITAWRYYANKQMIKLYHRVASPA